jgi:hypothetical protein
VSKLTEKLKKRGQEICMCRFNYGLQIPGLRDQVSICQDSGIFSLQRGIACRELELKR